MSDAGYHIGRTVPATSGLAGVGDYIQLLKPRVMALVVFTALTGMVVSPGVVNPVLAAVALLAIAAGAGAAGALNMWYDADIDALMQRTAARPIPRGKIAPEEALGFGVLLSFMSVMTLGLAVGWVAAGLLALTITFYLFVYTMWLKRRTPQNIVIGGAAGAFPPMIGWAAVTGDVSLDSCLMFLIIFLWTPPHFWALALYRCRDYERVGVPMLPVVAGARETRRQILIYSIMLVAASLAPFVAGLGGIVYLGVAAAAGAQFLWLALEICRRGDAPGADQRAKRLFGFSILYLFLLFAMLLGEHAVARLW
jgi:protoheme IX farnesyltransferase